MARLIFATAVVATASVVAFWGAAPAQTGSTTTGPTQADFDHCNRHAHLSAGASASPRSSAAGTGLATPGGRTLGTPSAGATQAPSGTTSAAGAGGAGGGSLSGGSTLSGSAGTSADAPLRGMAATGESDAAYQTAYGACMRARGF
jgi:hypothetical protein